MNLSIPAWSQGEVPSDPEESGKPSSGSGFSPHQRKLLRALSERDEKLSRIYHGGLSVLQDVTNPDHLSQCAHSIRELMEKLPTVLDVPVRSPKENLKPKVKELDEAFQSMRKKTVCCSDGGDWRGAIDRHLENFLGRRLREFFDWFRLHYPSRREEIRSMLIGLDPSRRELPKPLADQNIQAWNQIKEFFLAVCHHGRETTDLEIRDRIASLEQFLLDLLEPRTFEDFAEIDALIGGTIRHDR